MRFLPLLVLLSLLLAGCSSPLWEATVFNATDQPISLKTGKRNGRIQAGGKFERWRVKPEQKLQIKSPDKKLLKEYSVSELGFPEDKDAAVLVVHGEPANFALADYSEFYVGEGEEQPKDPEIKLVADLRGKSVVPIERSDYIAWPQQGLAETRYDGGGFKNIRFLRVVAIPAELPEEQLLDFLKTEMQEQLKTKK